MIMRISIQRRQFLAVFIVAMVAESLVGVAWYLGPTNYDPNAYRNPPHPFNVGAWSYSFYSENNDRIMNMTLEFHLNFLLMSMPTNFSDTVMVAKIIDIATRLKAHNVRLYWMTDEEGESPGGWNHTDNINRVKSICEFLVTKNLSISGIHLDLETGTDSTNFNDWLLMLSQIRAVMFQVLGPNRTLCPTLSAAICSCYDNPDVPNATATIMHKYLDFLVPMTYYCTKPSEFITLNNPLISQAPIAIGVGADTYHDSYSAMMRVLNTTAAYYEMNSPFTKNFMGFCVFHEDLLKMP